MCVAGDVEWPPEELTTSAKTTATARLTDRAGLIALDFGNRGRVMDGRPFVRCRDGGAERGGCDPRGSVSRVEVAVVAAVVEPAIAERRWLDRSDRDECLA